MMRTHFDGSDFCYKMHEVRKEPVAIPEILQAGARAPSFLEDEGSQTSIRSDHEEYHTPVRQTRMIETFVDYNPAPRQAGQTKNSCSELARELDGNMRRLCELEYSLRAEIQDLQGQRCPRPRVSLAPECVPRVIRDHRRYTSRDEIGFTPGAEEGLQRIPDLDVALLKESRRHRKRL